MTSSINPSAPSPHRKSNELARATQAIAVQDFATAEAILKTLIDRGDSRSDALRLLAFVQFKRGDLNSALLNAQQTVTAARDDALAWNTLGLIFDARGDWQRASNAFGTSCRLCPRSLKLWANWGKTLVEHEQFDRAIKVLSHALTLGEHSASRKHLAHALVATGRLDDAERHYRDQLAIYPTDGNAWFALASLGEAYLTEADAVALREREDDPRTTEDDKIGIRFALSRCAEKSGDFKLAFDLLTKANAAERRRVEWNAAAFTDFVTDVLHTFDAMPPPQSSHRGQGIVFILGMPRTGSSFVEQLIGQHPNAVAGGELPFVSMILNSESQRRAIPFTAWAANATAADWARLGEEYLSSIAERRGDASIFTDKRSGNWVYIGALVRMLPGARIIHTCRAPEDACFGCFRQRFSQGAQLFSYDLDECAAYLRDCERAMRFWQRHYPDVIRRQSHEALISEFPDETAALREFCGLPMLEAQRNFSHATITTASAAQLRAPRNVARSWNALYGALLEPIRKRVADEPNR